MVPGATARPPVSAIGIAIQQPTMAVPQPPVYNPAPPVKPVVKQSAGCMGVLVSAVSLAAVAGVLAAAYSH